MACQCYEVTHQLESVEEKSDRVWRRVHARQGRISNLQPPNGEQHPLPAAAVSLTHHEVYPHYTAASAGGAK